MLKRMLLCALLLVSVRAYAVDYTDIWYVPTESGWGANVVESDNFLFVTFFIYGADNKPTWYTAQLTLDASGNYNGKLYSTIGTFYSMPWKASDVILTEVGTASFQPTSPYTARLIYIVTAGSVTVTKSIQRQALKQIDITGSYFGAQAGTYSGCNDPANNGPYADFFSLQVTKSTSGSVVFSFNYQAIGVCTLSGTPTQFGKLYTMPTTAYKCSTLDTNASMAEITATSLGIEGRLSAPAAGQPGCREDATFSAVRH